MKTLTCKDLGGPCDTAFTAETFEEMGRLSHAHVVQQIQARDEAHMAAAEKMKTATPEEQQAMMAKFRKRFDEAKEV